MASMCSLQCSNCRSLKLVVITLLTPLHQNHLFVFSTEFLGKKNQSGVGLACAGWSRPFQAILYAVDKDTLCLETPASLSIILISPFQLRLISCSLCCYLALRLRHRPGKMPAFGVMCLTTASLLLFQPAYGADVDSPNSPKVKVGRKLLLWSKAHR